jgi:hypothetical protein
MKLVVKSKVSILKIQPRSSISGTAHQFFSAQFRNALRAWVRTILEKIPDYTGTYRGTIMPVGRALGGGGPGNAWYASGPKFTYNEEWRKRHKTIGYKIIRGHGRFTLGEAGGEAVTEFSIIDDIPGKYTFTYKTNLPWAIWNESFSAPDWMHLQMGTPAHAIKAGNDAFNHYIDHIMPTRKLYQKLAKMMIKSQIKSA